MTLSTLSPGFGGIYELTANTPAFTCNYENLIVHSRTREFDKCVEDSGLSIKLGVRGSEDYFFARERRRIDEESFLLVNKHQQFNCYQRSDEEVEALCFYLSPALVADIQTTLTRPVARSLDYPDEIGGIPVFRDRVYCLEENTLGAYLRQLRSQLLQPGLRKSINFVQLYYSLGEQLVGLHLHTEEAIDRLEAVRATTREELHRRLNQARQFIFDNYTREIDLDQLAKVALLSKFHLLRSYKQLYGVTPYRQVLLLRLERARHLLGRESSIAKVAYELGFSDRRAFAKAFRRQYGVPPSAWANR